MQTFTPTPVAQPAVSLVPKHVQTQINALVDERDHWQMMAQRQALTIANMEGHRTTTGGYQKESSAVAALLNIVRSSGKFVVHTERPSKTIRLQRWQSDKKGYRIDVILEPRDELWASGWPYGLMGIECKPSGRPFGKAILQMMDYHDATWDVHGREVVLDRSTSNTARLPASLPGDTLEALPQWAMA